MSDCQLGIEMRNVLGFRVYLDPKSMLNHGLYGYYWGFRAIILHTFGVQEP